MAEEKHLSIIQRVSNLISVKRTVQGAKSRSAKLREELAEAESVEDLIESLFNVIEEMLEEVEKAGIAQQRATTKMRNIAKDRKAQLRDLLSEE